MKSMLQINTFGKYVPSKNTVFIFIILLVFHAVDKKCRLSAERAALLIVVILEVLI